VLEQTAETARIPLPSREEAPRRSLFSAESRVKGIPVSLWLGLTVVVGTALRFAVAWRTPAPWIVPDEAVYSQLARSFADTGHFAVAGHPFSTWSFGPLYPMLVAPAYWVFGSLTHAYLAVKGLNCLSFASAAIPAYLLARRMLDRERALILAFLAVLIPSGIYTTKIMTESVSYPLLLVAVLSVVAVLERPSRRGEVYALAAIGLAALARAQLVVLLPAFISAALFIGALDHRDGDPRGARRYAVRQLRTYPITWLALAGFGVAVAVLAAFGWSLGAAADGHSPATANVDPVRVAQSFVLHLAALDLYVGVLPFAALAVMAGVALKRGAPRETRILCAFTISVSCWLAVAAAKYLVAAYPGSFLRIYDRYVFYAVPLVLVAFLVWLREGLPRPRGTVTVAAGAAALPAVIPYSHVLSGGEWGVSSSSVALVPWANLRFLVGTPLVVYPLLALGAVYLTYIFLRSKDWEWLVFLVAANFVVVSMFALWGNSAVAQQALREGVGAPGDRSWIDSAVGSDAQVDVLWAGSHESAVKARYALWEGEFFNRSVQRFYWLRQSLYKGYPGDRLSSRRGDLYLADGHRFRARYVLTDISTPVVGTKIAVNRAVGMAVFRTQGPVRLTHSLRLRQSEVSELRSEG
jgi:Dolichyl-phosphate-mannose-protein mannosyltransferase